MTAFDRVRALLEKGIRIVTTDDWQKYDKDSLRDPPRLMMLIVKFHRAHEESALKSERLRKTWQQKRAKAAEGKPLTSWCPGWLTLKDGKYEPIPDRVAVVRRIYEMALAGHGRDAITRTLNKEGVPTFGNFRKTPEAWHVSFIQSVLRNEAVIGRFQPKITKYDESGKRRRGEDDGEPIEGYFPAIIKKADFYRVQKMRGVSGYKGHELVNILSGLVTCLHCGSNIHFVNKGPLPRGGYYLGCDGARRKGICTAKPIRFDVAVTAVFRCLSDSDLDLRSLLDNGHKSRKAELQFQLEAVEAQISETDAKIENLLDSLELGERVKKRIADNQATLERLKREKTTLEGDIAEASNGGDPVADITGLISKWSANELVGDLRVRLNAALKRVIETIIIGYSWDASDWIGDQFINNLTSKKDFSKRHRERFALNLDRGAVSIEIRFKENGRCIGIAADPKTPDRLAAASAVLVDEQRTDVKLEEPAWKSNNYRVLNSVLRGQR